MRALQLVIPGRPLQLNDVAAPTAGAGDVVVDVAAAGICRSDVHYRSGFPTVGPLPLTLGHEVAGVVSSVGDAVVDFSPGDRVCLHYQVGCGGCGYCRRGFEQFCPEGRMIGNGRDGGFAEQIVIPARNTIAVPPSVPLEHAAVMMCSSATALHAIRKGRLQAGETVAVFGAGGLGVSAIQLARVFGARDVYAVEVSPAKLTNAANLGAIAVDARDDPVAALLAGGGVDVALDLVGSATVMENCLRSLAPMGRAVAVGLTAETLPVGPYTDLVNGESELIGASDHTSAEIEELLGLAEAGALDLTGVVQRSVPLDAGSVNRAMDELEQWSEIIRTVIVPGS